MHTSLIKRDKKSTNKLNKRDNNLTGWDAAIEKANRGIERLKLAIETFRERKKAGEPF